MLGDPVDQKVEVLVDVPASTAERMVKIGGGSGEEEVRRIAHQRMFEVGTSASLSDGWM